MQDEPENAMSGGSMLRVNAPYGFSCSFPFLSHRDHGCGLITGVWREAGNTGEQVKRDTLLSDAHDYPLRLLIDGDYLALLFSQRNNFRNFNLLRWFFWHTDSVD
jgi:hypothetical protein